MAKGPVVLHFQTLGYVFFPVLSILPVSSCSQEYDYADHFWTAINISSSSPPARWGAVGGIDPRTGDDALVNTFYMAGGYDGKTIYDLTNVWLFNVSGTISANLPHSVTAVWQENTISGDSIPGRVSMGGTVIGQKIVAVGGCDSASSSQAILDSTCAVQDSQIIDVAAGLSRSPNACLAPRIDPVVVPNMNTASPSFGTQVFVLLGTFNNTLWDDGGGLNRGEVVSASYVPITLYLTVIAGST